MERKLTEAIKQVEETTRHHGLTPQQFRYITREVRQNLKLVVPKIAKRLPDYLNPAEIYRLLDLSKHEPFDSLLLEFLIFTGLRVQEAKNLRVEHIDFTQHLLLVVQGKGGKDRPVPVTTNLQSKLLLWLNGRTRGYMFCKKNETPYSVRALQWRVTRWLDKLGSEKELSTHSLRHTFACLCLARGMTIYQVRDLLGHTSVKITEIYAKLAIENIKADFLRLMDMRG